MAKKKPIKMPRDLLDKVQPLLNAGESILCTFREPYRWHELQSRWLVLTELRLVIVYRTILGVVSIDEIHIRDLDIEYVLTKFGLFDLILFRTRERTLYQTAASRFRRAEVRDFIRTATTAITRREGAFRVGLSQPHPTSQESIKSIEGLNELKNNGAISEEEYEAKKQELLRKI